MTTIASDDETLSYLRKYAPDQLRELRARYPDDADLMRAEKGLGPVLGEAGSEGHGIDRQQVTRKIDSSERCLIDVRRRTLAVLPDLEKGIKQSDRLARSANIAALVGSSTLLATAQSSGAAVTYITGAITLFGALLTLSATERTKTWANGVSKRQMCTELRGKYLESDLALDGLRTWRPESDSLEWGNSLIKQANTMAEDMNRLLASVPAGALGNKMQAPEGLPL